jgi:drug/metabolite transporter (DMT)-like permease
MGEMLIILATLLWAVENTFAKHVLKNLSGNMVAFGRMFFGSLFIFAFLVLSGKAQLLTAISPGQVEWILITAGMLALYVITWYNGLKYVDASLATAVLLLGSPVTTLLASGAAMTLDKAFGSFLLVAGIVTFMNSTQHFSVKELLRSWTTKTKA